MQNRKGSNLQYFIESGCKPPGYNIERYKGVSDLKQGE